MPRVPFYSNDADSETLFPKYFQDTFLRTYRRVSRTDARVLLENRRKKNKSKNRMKDRSFVESSAVDYDFYNLLRRFSSNTRLMRSEIDGRRAISKMTRRDAQTYTKRDRIRIASSMPLEG